MPTGRHLGLTPFQHLPLVSSDTLHGFIVKAFRNSSYNIHCFVFSFGTGGPVEGFPYANMPMFLLFRVLLLVCLGGVHWSISCSSNGLWEDVRGTDSP